MAVTNNPSSYKRRLTKNNSNIRFPSETPKIYTRIVFHEYNRDVSSGVPKHQQVGSIILPIPEDVSDQTNININNTELGDIRALMELGKLGIDQISKLKSADDGINAMQAGMDSSTNMTKSHSVSSLLALTPIVMDAFPAARQMAEATGGIVRNPHTTALFNGVNLKSHSFAWRLSPRNQGEADTMMDVIKEFKYRALPSYDVNTPTARFALKYPELVTVSFEGTDSLDDVGFAFIESVNISHFPNGPAFFKDGKPVEVQISISLRETDIQTKESLE